jgi:MOSC domain-containing protein YiiM
MHVSSVNVAGAPTRLKVGSRMTSTGIDKRPADRPVEIGPLGLDGDTIWSKKHHGGPDQAVYVYGEDDYAWWVSELGRPMEPGTFGENLTVAGLATGSALVGDRLQIGAAVVLEVTCGRIPCGTLTARMGIRAFTQRFRKAARPGLYCRVIETGAVRAGDAVRYAPAAGSTLGIVEFGEMFYANDLTREQLERALAAPICERGRRDHELQLAALLRSP